MKLLVLAPIVWTLVQASLQYEKPIVSVMQLQQLSHQLRIGALAVLLLFAVGQSLADNHVHADGGVDIQCEVCLHADHNAALLPTLTDAALAPLYRLTTIDMTCGVLTTTPCHTFQSRAPPNAL